MWVYHMFCIETLTDASYGNLNIYFLSMGVIYYAYSYKYFIVFY